MRISDWSSDVCSSAAVGPRIEHTGDVARPRMRLAVIGEPEAAMRIEDDVVGATQRRAGGLGVERLDRTAGDIDALDRPAGIIGGGAVRAQQPIRLDPAETKIRRAHV